MDLELGLKLTRALDEFSSADFHIAKDRAGPLFLSRETERLFILTAHLKGYKKGNIKIDINEDGSLIAISGEKAVQETVILGWTTYKKDVEMKGFRKVFRIPDGVILDKITAKFNDDESTLTMSMPKKVKGIRGISLEEVQEQEPKQEPVKEGSGNLQIAEDKVPRSQNLDKEMDEEKDTIDKTLSEVTEVKPGKEEPEDKKIGGKEPKKVKFMLENEMPKRDSEYGETDDRIGGETQRENLEKLDHHAESSGLKTQDEYENGKETDNGIDDEELSAEESCEEAEYGTTGREEKCKEKKSKICTPIIAGSALLLSIVVFVIGFIRSKNQASKRKH